MNLLRKLYKTVFEKRKGIFIVVVLCLLLCNVSFLYSAEMLYKIAYSNANIYYKVDTKNTTLGQLKNQIKDLDTDKYYDAYLHFGDGIMSPIKGTHSVLYGRGISADAEILAGNFSGASETIGATVEIFGKRFTVAGVCNVECSFLLAPDALDDGFPVEEVRLRTFDFKQSAKTIRNLKTNFDGYDVQKIGRLSFAEDFLSNPITLALVAVDFMSIMGLVLCSLYLTTGAARTLRIYNHLGLAERSNANLYVYFMLVLLAAVCIAGGIVFAILNLTLLRNAGVALGIAQYSLRIGDILLVDVLMCIIALAIYLTALIANTDKKRGAAYV